MKPRPLPPNTKLHSEKAKKVFSGVRFDIYQWQQEQFDGSLATYELVKRDDTVVIIPIIDNEIVLVNEQQPHWEKPGHVLIAGMVHHDEDLDVAARRELEEETGLIFENYYLIHLESTTASVEWMTYTFITTGYKGKKDKKLDAGEKNDVVRVSLDKLIEMTRKRELVHRPRFIEDLMIQGKIEELGKILKNPEKYKIGL